MMDGVAAPTVRYQPLRSQLVEVVLPERIADSDRAALTKTLVDRQLERVHTDQGQPRFPSVQHNVQQINGAIEQAVKQRQIVR